MPQPPAALLRFGTLPPGERVTLRVRVQTARTGRFVNRVAVNSSTAAAARSAASGRGRGSASSPRQVPQFTG